MDREDPESGGWWAAVRWTLRSSIGAIGSYIALGMLLLAHDYETPDTLRGGRSWCSLRRWSSS
jgi:hypothetical protein